MPDRPEQKKLPAKCLTQGHHITKRSSRRGRGTARNTHIAHACLPESNLTAGEISLRAEIGSLKEKNEKLRQDIECENRRWRQVESLYKDRPGFEGVAELLWEKNWLQRRLNAYQKEWATFLPRNLDQITPKDSSEMPKRVFMFQHEFNKLLVTDVIDGPYFGRLKGRSQDLDCLLTDVFGMGSATEPQGMSEVFPDNYTYHLVQALVGAALKSWVFQSDFRTHHFAQTEVRMRSLDILRLIWDLDKLYDFDRACHESIIRDPLFSKEGVKGTVEQLENRFATTFQSVFKSKTGREKLDSSLRSVIHAAVMLRAEMLVDEKSYELLWPQAGSQFSRDEMEISRDFCSTTPGIVTLPLCPGFKAITKKEATIDYAGLTMAATSIPEATCVAKALVC